MPEPFTARYDSRCDNCGGSIFKGQEIIFSRKFGPANLYAHAVAEECVDGEPLGDPLAVPTGNSLCPNCFLYHPEGACDRD